MHKENDLANWFSTSHTNVFFFRISMAFSGFFHFPILTWPLNVCDNLLMYTNDLIQLIDPITSHDHYIYSTNETLNCFEVLVCDLIILIFASLFAHEKTNRRKQIERKKNVVNTGEIVCQSVLKFSYRIM